MMYSSGLMPYSSKQKGTFMKRPGAKDLLSEIWIFRYPSKYSSGSILD
jgi:hypothetical protein